MRIKTWENGENYLWHCSWQSSPKCMDRGTTEEVLAKVAAKFGIEKISSGICCKCLEILENKDK